MVKISVIMSLYNEPEDWITQSVESILNQSFSDFEFIIINDNPKRIENSLILNKYKAQDKRIVIINNKNNIGLTRSLNKGITIAKGKYIARMDADDISYPNRFAKQFDFLEANIKYIVCGTQISYFGNNTKYHSADWIKNTHNQIESQMFLSSCFAHPSVFIRKSVLDDNYIKYDESILYSQDYKLWTELIKYGCFYNLKEKLLKYRVGNGKISEEKRRMQNDISISIRRNYILNFLKKLPNCNIIDIPNRITLNFIEEVKKLRQINKLYLTSQQKIIIDKIIVVLYLSASRRICFSFIFSKELFRHLNDFSNLLRIIERCFFPNKKLKRL